MTVLGLETALPRCAAAIASAGRVASTAESSRERAHAEEIFGLISRCMAEAGTAYGGLDGVAVSAGPGSFTGLRIGYGVAKGLAFDSNIRFAAVPTPDAIAAASVARHRIGDGPALLCIVEAGRGEVFLTMYQTRSGRAVRLSGPVVVRSGDLSSVKLPAGDVYLTGSGPGLAAGLAEIPGVPAPVDPAEVAASIALLGSAELAAGRAADASAAEPMYYYDMRKEIP